MKYHHNFNDRKRRRFIHRIEFFVGLIVLLLVVVGVVMYILSTNDEAANQSEQSSSSASTTAYYAANVQVFRTPYFQFQADRTWSEALNESKNGKYVYRSLSNSLIKHEFVVYVGRSAPSSIPVTHVLPVTIVNENSLKGDVVSDHCSKALPAGQKGGIRTLTYQGVTFDCFADNTQFNVIVGQIGGTPKLSLLRPEGVKETYTIYYSNVTATPEPSQLQQIIASFQTR